METSSGRIAADAFADAVGESRDKIKLVDPQWRSLLKACCIINIHVTRWRAETTLTLADLGIETKDAAERKALDSLLNLGSRYLLPRSVIERGQHLENKFRNALWRHSVPSHFGNLVPQTQFVAWRAEATAIKAAYDAWVREVYERWPSLMADVEADYRLLGLQTYNRLVQSGYAPSLSMNAWVETFVRRCMTKCETADYWLGKARMWWDDPTFIPLTELTSDEALEIAYANAKNEMERDIYAGAKKHFEEGLFQFMADVRGEITERVFNVMVDILTAMDKNDGELPRNSSKQLKNLLEAVDALKFWDDPKLDEQMGKIRGMLAQRSYERDYGSMQETMRMIGAEAREVLFSLGRPIQRRSRQVGIPETEQGIGTILRQQRRSLDLSDDEMVAAPSRQQRTLEVVAA